MNEWMIFGWKGKTVMLTQDEYKEYEENKHMINIATHMYVIERCHSKCKMILERGIVRHMSKDYIVTKKEK